MIQVKGVAWIVIVVQSVNAETEFIIIHVVLIELLADCHIISPIYMVMAYLGF
jgi:hypothetical protein